MTAQPAPADPSAEATGEYSATDVGAASSPEKLDGRWPWDGNPDANLDGDGVDGASPPPLPVLDVRFDRSDRRITARGELDHASAARLADVMELVIDLGPADCTVDLAGVSFIDAGGIGALVGFANRLAGFGAKLTVTGVAPGRRHVFELVGLSGMLEVQT